VRPVAATIALLDELGADELGAVVAEHGPGAALAALYRGHVGSDPVVRAAATSDRPEARWVTELARRYPGDPSVAATPGFTLRASRR
jgi:hypothetical protein